MVTDRLLAASVRAGTAAGLVHIPLSLCPPVGAGAEAGDFAELLVEVLGIGNADLVADFLDGQIAGEKKLAGELHAAEQKEPRDGHGVVAAEEARDIVGAPAAFLGQLRDGDWAMKRRFDGLDESAEGFFGDAAARALRFGFSLQMEPEEKLEQRGAGGDAGGGIGLFPGAAIMIGDAPDSFADGGGAGAEAEMKRQGEEGIFQGRGRGIEMDAEMAAVAGKMVDGDLSRRRKGDVAGLKLEFPALNGDASVVIVEMKGDGRGDVMNVVGGNGEGKDAGHANAGKVTQGPGD